MGDFAVFLWCLAIGAFAGIGILFGVAVHHIRQKEKEAAARGTETSISTAHGCLSVLLPILFCSPLLYLFIVAYLDDGGVIFLVLSLIVALFIVAVIFLSYASSLRSGNEELDSTEITLFPKEGKDGLGTDTKAMISIMGAKLLDMQLDREKEAREQNRHESLYWQEDVRNEMQEDVYEEDDADPYDDDD